MTALRELAERWNDFVGDNAYDMAVKACRTQLLSILDAEGDAGAAGIAWLTPGGDVSRSWSWCNERCQPGQKPIRLYTHPQPVRSGVVSDEQFDTWRDSLPAKHWAKYDISACKLGWDAALEHFAKSQGESNV